jgi:multiple sugar transport system permease protein
MIDGAGDLHKFRYVTLPLLSPVIFFQLVLGLIGALQTFTQSFLLRGGDSDSALFYNYYLWQNAFSNGRMGFASAMAWLLFGITLIFTLLVFRSSALWVFYENQGKK